MAIPFTPSSLAFAKREDNKLITLSSDLLDRCKGRAKKVIDGLNDKQKQVIRDPSPLIGACCPRRAGKTFLGASLVLATLEATPGAIAVVVCMSLRQGRKTWWYGATSGITALAQANGIPITTNENELRWEHENGSIGYIMSAESREALESMRGMEADLYVIDECKSVQPHLLRDLLDDIITPQTVSRDGRVVMIGTPGTLLEGPFWEATCAGAARDEVDEETEQLVRRQTNIPFGQPDPWGRPVGDYWSYHSWTLADNNKTPKAAAQWERALRIKRKSGWRDDNPTWQREYLGMWVASDTGLVFKYNAASSTGNVTWRPSVTPDNPTGLPADKGPWRMVWGLDIGSHDPTAIVVVAYSETHQEMRHVHDEKHQHLVVDQIAELLKATALQFGPPDAIFADTGGLGVMVVNTLRQVHGFHIEAAEKRNKNDHIELLNNEFHAGRCKIIPGSALEHQLKTVHWDLSSKSRELLARTGNLKEDPLIPNDLTDALMYAFRGCMHLYSVGPVPTFELTVEAAFERWEAKNLARRAARFRAQDAEKQGGTSGPVDPRWGGTTYDLEHPPWKMN